MSRTKGTRFDDELLHHIRLGRNIQARSTLNPELAEAHDDFGTLLHYAVTSSNVAIARYLLELGAEVDSLDSAGRTSLMLAVRRGHSGIVKVLLEAHPNVYITDNKGTSALRMVFDGDCFDCEIVGAFLREIQAESGTTDELVERLIDAGCSLYRATFLRRIEVIERMLKRGIDVDSEGPFKQTALHAAAKLNDSNLINWLISNGADVNALDEHGYSALLLSASNRNEDTMEILLERGADPNCRDRICGHTPLIKVFVISRQADEAFVECAELLLQYGTVLQTSTCDVRTMFECALNWSSVQGVELLLGHLAVLQMLGRSIGESVVNYMYVKESFWFEISKCKKYYEACLQVLATRMFEKLSLLDLLHESKTNMRLLVRRETFVFKVKKVCSKHKLKKLHSYYYNTLTKRIAKAKRAVKLEGKAIPVICKIFEGNYNQCYNFARKVVDYLDEHDLKQLVAV